MTRVQPTRNGEDARDLVGALLANAAALREEVSRLHGDVGRLHGKIKGMHRATDRLHRKIEGTHARIRIFRSQGRTRRHKQSLLVSASR